MTIRLGQNGEMAIVLKMRDDGSIVVEKFAETADKSAKKSGKAFDDFSSGAGINFKSIATYSGIAAAAVVAGGIAMVSAQIDVADQTLKTANAIGSTTEALSAMTYAVEKAANMTREQLFQSLNMMQNNLATAAQGIGEARYAVRDLGLDLDRLVKMKPEQQFEAIVAALDKMPPADRIRVARDIFGPGGQDIIKIKGGSEALRELYAEAERMDRIISTDSARAAAEFNDNIGRLKSNLQGLANTIMKSVLPGLLAMTDAMTGNESLPTLMLKQARVMQMLADAREQMEGIAAEPFGNVHDDISDLESELDRINAKIQQQRKKIADSAAAAAGAGTGPNSRLDEETQKQVLENQAKVAEEIAKAREQRLQGLQDRLADLQNSFLAEDEAELVHYEQSIALLYEAWNTRIQVDEFGNTERLLSDEQFKKQREQLEIQHQAKLGSIEAQGQLQRLQFERLTMRQKTKTIIDELLIITQGVAQHNRFLFEINKVAAIADAIISAHEGAARTLAKYPWPLGPVLAALHYAAGIARVSAIQSTSFGAPSATGAVGVYAASPNTGFPTSDPTTGPGRADGFGGALATTPAQPAAPRPIINITLNGSNFSYDATVELIERINEAIGNGAEINLR